MNANGKAAKAYWEKIESVSEKEMRKVAEKFRLKFATVISDEQTDAESQRLALESDGLVGLAAKQDNGIFATFHFYS